MARPTYKPTIVARRQVALAAGAGMSHESMAIALGISRNTLEKHFEAELSVGGYRRRMEMLEALYRAGKKGNAAAAKAYLANEPQLAAPPAPRPEAAKKPPALGKKEQAQADAVGAHGGTEWEELLKVPTPVAH